MIDIISIFAAATNPINTLIRDIQDQFGVDYLPVAATIGAIILPWCFVVISLISRARNMPNMPSKNTDSSIMPTEGSNKLISDSVATDIKRELREIPVQEPVEMKSENMEDEHDEDAAPFHLLAMKGSSARLLLSKPGSQRRLSMSRSSSVSRSRSSSPPTVTTSNTGLDTFDDSSSSTLNDILTDRMGFEDLPQHHHQNASNSDHTSSLTLVVERASEDTLDDCHAFTGAFVSSGSGRKLKVASSEGSVAGISSCNDSVLKTLDELESDEENEVENSVETNHLAKEVIFELDNLKIDEESK